MFRLRPLPDRTAFLARLGRIFLAALALLWARTSLAEEPTTVVVIGATGDLTSRLLMPGFVQLSKENLLPAGARIVGMALPSSEFSGDEGFRSWMKTRLDKIGGGVDANAWDKLVGGIHFQGGNLSDPADFEHLKQKLAQIDEQDLKAGVITAPRRVVFYFAIAPNLMPITLDNLAKAGLVGHELRNDVVLEKPIGIDEASAKLVNEKLDAVVGENHVYRMDHYLGKTSVRSLHQLRFMDPRFKAIWNKKFIERIEVSSFEKLGVEGRGSFYEQTGATADMVQSHLLQVLAMATMDEPASGNPADLRKSKIALLKALVPMKPERLGKDVVRGQYKAGGTAVGYASEPGVSPDSSTETFVAMKLNIGTRAWKNVPIHVMTGKGLGEKQSFVKVHFKRLPAALALALGNEPGTPAVLTLGIDPKPSLSVDGKEIPFSFVDGVQLSPYGNQLRSILAGDPSLFLHRDESEASWKLIDPIKRSWVKAGLKGLKKYAAGSSGPSAAQKLLRRGYSGVTPRLRSR